MDEYQYSMNRIKAQMLQEKQLKAELSREYKDKSRQVMQLKIEIDKEKMRQRGSEDVETDVIDYYLNFSQNSLVKSKNFHMRKVNRPQDFKSKNSVLKSQNDL